MKLFLDTEFTDFIDIDLISIGLVAEDGREFYAERNDFDLDACNSFVQDIVLPLLGMTPGAVIGSKDEIRDALLLWLTQFEQVDICIDYISDGDLFVDLCHPTLPDGIQFFDICPNIDQRRLEQFWNENPMQEQHHALHDARANKFAYTIM